MAPGKAADLLLVEGDPLGDITALARPVSIYLSGIGVAEGGRLLSGHLLA